MLITLYSAKGGQGTSVTAAALALEIAKSSTTNLYDMADGDLAPILGIPSNADGVSEVTPALTLTTLHQDLSPNNHADSVIFGSDVRVVDAGLIPNHAARHVLDESDHRLLVIRGCYLALRKATASDIKPTGIILISEPQRSLGLRDIEDVLGVPVIGTIPFAPAVSRTVDAGLFPMRMPPSMQVPIKNIAWHLTSIPAVSVEEKRQSVKPKTMMHWRSESN